MDLNRKLKSLALILRSLPPNTQKSIFEQLPLPLVQRISDVDLSIEETLSQEDWDYFAESWPEFYKLIDKVKSDAKVQRCQFFLKSERPKIREYLQYRLKQNKIRPNLSHAVAKIVDEIVFETI
jgi:hypothetical protein